MNKTSTGKLTLGAVLLGLFLAATTVKIAFAQPPIEQIVVVASKTQRTIHQIAANVSVQSRDEIKDNLVTSLDGVFEYTPGIDVESAGTRFGNESINIRGIGGNRVAMLIDGVPLGDQFDVGNFSNATRDFVNAGLIQRAEILHGPASSLYGSDAIGGVVALYTPQPTDFVAEQGWGGEFGSTWHDADNSAHIQAILANRGKSVDFLGAVSIRDGQESEPANALTNGDQLDYRRQSVLFKASGNSDASRDWQLTYIHQDSETESDLRSMLGSGRFRSTTQLLGDDQSTLDLAMLKIELGRVGSLFESATLGAYYQFSDVAQATHDERALARTPATIERVFEYQQKSRGLDLNLQNQLDFGWVNHQFAVGLDYQEKTTEELRNGSLAPLSGGLATQTVLGEQFPVRDFPISDTRELGAYVEYNLSAYFWTAIVSLRADDYKLDARPDALYLEDNPATRAVSLSESDLSPKVGLVFHLSDQSEIYFQYAHGFRAPPFEDANIGLDIPRFNIRAIPNPELRSERSNGFDLGLRWRTPVAKLHIGFFHTDYKDFIETKVRLGLDPVSGRILFQSQNLARAQIQGIEADWQWQVTSSLGIHGGVYVADGNNEISDQPLNSVGPEQLILGLDWRSTDERRSVRLRGTTTGDWDERDESGGALFKPGGHTTFDLFYAEKISDRLTLRAALRNITDKQYWHWSEVSGFAPDDPVLTTLARPGRQISLSIESQW